MTGAQFLGDLVQPGLVVSLGFLFTVEATHQTCHRLIDPGDGEGRAMLGALQSRRKGVHLGGQAVIGVFTLVMPRIGVVQPAGPAAAFLA